MENVEYKLGDEISKGSFTGTFVKMANCDNQIYDFWIHEFFNNPKCTCDGKGGLEMHRLDNIYGCLECAGDDEEESFAGLCEVCGNHTVSAPNRSEVVCTFCPAVVA